MNPDLQPAPSDCKAQGGSRRTPALPSDPAARAYHELTSARKGTRIELDHRGLSARSLPPLLESSALDGVTALSLRGNMLDATAIEALAHSPRLASLRTLDLSGNPLGERGLAALLAAPVARNLTSLRLRACHLHERAFEVLRDAPPRSVERLELGRNRPGLRGLHALRELDLPALQALHLDACALGPELGAALAAARALPPLHTLILDRNALGMSGLRALLEAPCLEQLAVLSVRACGLDAADGRHPPLAALGRLRATLQHLDLSGNRIGNRGLATVLDTLEDSPLAALGVADCGLDPRLARLLVESCADQLRHLEL